MVHCLSKLFGISISLSSLFLIYFLNASIFYVFGERGDIALLEIKETRKIVQCAKNP